MQASRSIIVLLAVASVTLSCNKAGGESKTRAAPKATESAPTPDPTPRKATPTEAEANAPTTSKAEQLDDSLDAGKALFQSHRCWFCHNVSDAPPKFGPNLTRVGATLKRDALITWIKNPKALKPTTKMPAFTGTAAELEQMVDYMISLR